MEDKRILKTKRSLKKAMTEMLDREDFEHISITELCGRAEVSRITFYSHYSDKYAFWTISSTTSWRWGRKIITGGRRRTIREGN